MSQISINSLPGEILSEILLYFPGLDEPLDDLRLVSRLWNHTIISTPALWTYIKVDVYPPTLYSIERSLELSRQLPLELYLNFLEEDLDDQLEFSVDYLDVLWGSIHRWRKLTLVVDENLVHLFSHRPLSNAVLLEWISIRLCESEDPVSEDVVPMIFQSLTQAPALRHLEYSPLDFPTAETMVNSKSFLNQLSSLELTIPHQDCIKPTLEVIHECTSILWISLALNTYPYFTTADDAAWPRLHLPNLRILELRQMYTFGPFHFPNLQVLSILSEPHLMNTEAISTYISTSKHSLKVLRLRAMKRCDLTKFFANRDLVRIPILEVQTMRDEKVDIEDIRREVLDRMWERFGEDREPTFAAVDSRVTALGWVDPKVLPLFKEYFSMAPMTMVRPGFLPSY